MSSFAAGVAVVALAGVAAAKSLLPEALEQLLVGDF